MQLKSFLLLPAPLLLVATAHGGIDVEEQEAGMHFEIFTDSDDVRVKSQSAAWRVDLARGAELALNLLREVVIVPGITAAPGSQEAVDSISGASRPIATAENPYSDWSKDRGQLEASARVGSGTAGYYVSREDDYFAQQLSGGFEKSFLDDNVVFAAGASFGWDRIEPLEDADTTAPEDHKNTRHGNVMATWVLTPVTVMQGGFELTHVEGLQHNPYRNVYVDGAWVPELHPDSRSRRDVFLKASRWLPNRSAVKAEYRLYSDDWGIVSHTVGARLHQYVGGDAFVVRYRYRFYSQGAADFWREEYTQPGGVDGYRSADYRVGDFDAHLFGTKVTWNVGDAPFSQEWLGRVGVDVSYERYFNTNNFSANLFEIGLGLTY